LDSDQIQMFIGNHSNVNRQDRKPSEKDELCP